ncbi:NAD(P)-dependent alcohol dehydrogenase [Frankia sp. Cr2]|uniref:NAD(P)-dependent alcohol dehydrogenase n=1 Tax=Frankia sp. Cr2 TaxID=3073932 RepID=UPI002AD57E5C|nr:NAD(P)-dependent alcohol dehydrogenase [Frankia sp. Cr2]
MDITAAVLRQAGATMALELLQLEAPRRSEIVVEIAGTGICHTDLSFRDGHWPYPLPAVLGHEGAGTVVAVGEAVTDVVVGDRVVLSSGSCGTCPACLSARPAECPSAALINMRGSRGDGSIPLSKHGEPVHATFVCQSSFATHALTESRFAVKLPDDVPLELAGTLGCGVQTGAGAVLNALRPRPGSSVAVFGLGAVGLSAVAAAKYSGATRILAVDVNPARLELATIFGATDLVDANSGDAVAMVQALVPGGVDGAVEASGNPLALPAAFLSTHGVGTTILVGAAAPGTQYAIDSLSLLAGRTLRGATMGLSNPRVFIPQLVAMWRAGLLPLEAMSRTFPLSEIEAALAAAADGSVVKPVLVPA